LFVVFQWVICVAIKMGEAVERRTRPAQYLRFIPGVDFFSICSVAALFWAGDYLKRTY